MNKILGYLKSRSIGWYFMACAVLLSLVCLIFYAVSSPNNLKGSGVSAFDAEYLIILILGLVLAVADLVVDSIVSTKIAKYLEFFAPVAAGLLGVAFGIMVADMLPTASDIWNGVVFIGGDFEAYLAYTILTFLPALAAIAATFLGTKKKP